MKSVKFLVFFLILIFPYTLNAQSPDDIIGKIEARYSKKTFQSDFFQQSTLKALDIKQSAGGYVIFSHPGKMYWTYNFPDKNEIVTNGETVWLYTEKNNQVQEMEAKNYFKEGMGGAFLANIGSIKKNYSIKDIKTDEKENASLLLLPNTKGPVKEIYVTVSKKDGRILKVTTVNQSNDETIFYFKNEKFIENIDKNIFNFVPPKGAKITTISQ